MKRLITVLSVMMALLLLAPIKSYSDDAVVKRVKDKLPKMLGANNIGKEFWVTIPPCYEVSGDSFIKVFVTSAVETLCTIEVPGKGYFTSQKTKANDVIEFNIMPTIGAPYSKDDNDPEVPEQVYRGAGMHIYADQPLVVYIVVRYQATSDGFLALPASSLGREYIVASYGDMTAMFGGLTLPSLSGIVAAHDNTQVSFQLGGNYATETAGGMKPGETKRTTLMQGDVWMFSSKGNEADLTGSKIVASKPIGVVSGNQCANIPLYNQWCDYVVEMDIPTFTWGSAYHVYTVANRTYASLVRTFAKEPQTNIYRDGKQIGYIKEAGGIIGKAYLEMRVVPMDWTPRSAVFSADKPFGMTLYNCGVQEDGYPLPNSDPFICALTPIEQYQQEITFCTPGVNGSGFNENYLNIVYQTDENRMMPADMEFAEVRGGQFEWTQLRFRFSGMDEQFQYDVDGKSFALKKVQLPGEGVFKLRATRPFAAYSYGYAWCDSYGFPTSAALADIEKPDTSNPDPKWEQDCDGLIEGATVTDMPDDEEIRSNLSMIVFDAVESFNYKFGYDGFVPGQDWETKWWANVVDLAEDARAVITFIDRRGNDTTIAIDYYATKLAIRPESVDYGLHKMGETSVKDFWVINESELSPVNVTEIKLQSGNENFELLDITLPIEIEPMDSVKFRCEFTAAENGTFHDSIGVGDECMFWYKAYVEASVGEPTIAVSDIAFGDVSVGTTTAPRTFTIQNNGTVDLRITGYTGPSSSVYSTDIPNNINESNPLIIKSGASAKVFNVTFTPDAETTYPDQILFHSDADRTDSICLLSGRGIAPSLIANGYDWGKRRINRPNFSNDGPYPPDNNFKCIVLDNQGSQSVTIAGLNVITDTRPDPTADAFDLEAIRQAVTGLQIPDSSSVVIPVEFNPTFVGEYELILEYDNTAGSETQTRLAGTGILPRMTTSDYDFDTTIVGDVINAVTRTIVFTNESYQWEDDLTIANFDVLPNASDISIVSTSWGDEGFQFEKSSLGFPVTLKPGASLTFDARFVAQDTRVHTASIRTQSDAEAEQTSNWTGFGLSQNFICSGDDSYLCLGEVDTLNVTIENTGTGTFNVTSIDFNPVIPEFSFADPIVANGFLMQPNETRIIKIIYYPSQAGTHNTIVEFTSDIDDYPMKSTSITARTDFYQRTCSITPTDQRLDISQQPKIQIMFNAGTNISKAEVKTVDVRMTYLNDFLQVKPEDVKIGSLVNGKFNMDNLVVDQSAGTVSFTLNAIGDNFLAGNGELATVNFYTYLPKDTLQTAGLSLDVNATGNECVDISSSGATITLNPTCVNDLRKVVVSTDGYALQQISPNPVSSGNAEIEFTVALENLTTIEVYNSMGEMVKTLINEKLPGGAYSVRVPVEDLSSGVYWYKMTAGPFTQTRQMVIEK